MRRSSSQVPAEHGSWAFLLLPTLAALALNPSAAGSWLLLASLLLFLIRVPLKRTLKAKRLLKGDGFLLGMEAAACLGALGLALPAMPMLGFLLLGIALPPAGLALVSDLRGTSRSLGTEMLSILAPCLLGGAVLASGGGSLPKAGLLAAASFLSLAAPVSYLRSVLARQRGRANASPVPTLLVHGAAIAGAFALYATGGMGWLWPAWMGALALRAAAEPLLTRRLPDARSLGTREALVSGMSACMLFLSLRGPFPIGP